MATLWFRRTVRTVIATVVVVVTALALLWTARFWWQRLSLPWDGRMAAAIAVPAVALLCGIWWLWWRLPRRQLHRLDVQIHDPKARADTEDNFRKTVGQALGGAAVLIAALAAYLQFTQQQQTATQQIAAQQKIASDQIAAQMVAKGFEQLANKDSVVMRLGGIYALEGVMNTSPQYHQPVLEALCAFVRDSTTPQQRNGAAGVTNNGPPTDIQAALTVIGRRKQGSGDVNLTGASILGVDLRGADLSGARLDYANLSGARLDDAKLGAAQLNSAILSRTYLNGADLSYAYLDKAYLRAAQMFRARLINASLLSAHLNEANLFMADLSGAYLDYANLSGARLNKANLSGAKLNEVNLSDADLSEAHLDTDLSEVRGLTQEQLNHACGKPKALPPGLTLDKPCPPRTDAR
jgi:hypothetical protein